MFSLCNFWIFLYIFLYLQKSLYSTISDKDSKIAGLDALIEEKESKIQTLNCRIVSNENAHKERLSAELKRQEHILTEKHEKEVSELNDKISVLETTIKALTDKFNDAMAFIKELCMSAATLISQRMSAGLT